MHKRYTSLKPTLPWQTVEVVNSAEKRRSFVKASLSVLVLVAVVMTGCTSGIKSVEFTPVADWTDIVISKCVVVPTENTLVSVQNGRGSTETLNGITAATKFCAEIVEALKRRGVDAVLAARPSKEQTDGRNMEFRVTLVNASVGDVNVPVSFEISAVALPRRTRLADYKIQVAVGMDGYRGIADDLIRRMIDSQNRLSRTP